MMDSHIPKDEWRTISPLIFNVLTHDVVQRIQTDEVRMWLYADDMMLRPSDEGAVQQVIATNGASYLQMMS